jgi:RNA polymerase sigma-70 factor, ECF subfamily
MATSKPNITHSPWAEPRRLSPWVLEPTEPGDLRMAFAAHGGELFGFAFRSLRDRNLAEEAVQETFLRAWRARHRYDASIAAIRSWLFAIERRVIIDLVRARTRHDSRVAPATPEIPASIDPVDRALESWQVQEAIRRLPVKQRHVLVELFYRRRTSTEVAADLGIPEGTVRSRLFYGLQALRRFLEEMGWEA